MTDTSFARYGRNRLTGKAVLVSGAASGMGAACAELASAEGAAVFAVDRDEAKLALLADRIGARRAVCDLTQIDELPGLVALCVEAFGRLDGLVNAAGIFQTRDMHEIAPSEFDAVFAINVRSLFFLQQAAAKVMFDNPGGSIVNFASTAARVPRPISSHYAASKAAVVSVTKSAAAAWGRRGVRVNAVCPGIIDTPMIAQIVQHRAVLYGVSADKIAESWREMNPMGRFGTPEEVAEVVLFLLSDASRYVTGESLGINGGSDDI